MNTMRQSNYERGDPIFGESLLFQDTYRVWHSSRSTSCDGSPEASIDFSTAPPEVAGRQKMQLHRA